MYTNCFWTKLDSGQLHYCQLTAVKNGYPLTCITWLYCRLKCLTHWGQVTFFEKLFADHLVVFNWSRAQFQNFSWKKLCLVVSIVSPGSFPFNEYEVEWPLTRGCWKFRFFIVLILRITLNRPYNRSLSNLVRSVITGKRLRGQYIKAE